MTQPRANNNTFLMTSLIIPLASLIIGLGTATYFYPKQRESNVTIVNAALDDRLTQISQAVIDNVSLYQYGLRGYRGAVLTEGIDYFDYTDSLIYINSRNHAVEFPGARGFGLIRRVQPENESEFAAAAALDRGAPFNVRQLNPHDEDLFIIQYIEPESNNAQAVGLDIGSERMRREAALSAAASNAPQLTGPITLVQAADQSSQGFLILVPIFSPDAAVETPEQRRENVVAWAYSPLLAAEIIEGSRPIAEDIELDIYDVSAEGITHIYQSSEDGTYREYPDLIREHTISLFGREWALRVNPHQSFIDQLDLTSSAELARGIIVLAFLIGVFAYMLQLIVHRRVLLMRERSELAAVVISANEAIIGVNGSGKVKSWNPAAQRMFSFSEQEILGKTLQDLTVPKECLEEQKYIQAEVGKGNRITGLDTLRCDKFGNKIAVMLNIAPVLDRHGTVIGAAITVNDIRELKAAELALQEANANLEALVEERTLEISRVSTMQRSILDGSSYAIISSDVKGVVTTFNTAAERMTGFSAEEMVGKLTPSVFHDADEVVERANFLSKKFGREIDAGFPVFAELAENEVPEIQEWTYIRKNNERVPVNLKLSTLKDESGELKGYLGIAIDLSMQKYLEFELELASLSTESTSDLLFWLDSEQRIMKTNPASSSVLLVENESLSGRSMASIDSYLATVIKDDLLKMLRLRKELHYDSLFKMDDGETLPVSVTASLVTLSGKDYIYLVARDVSEWLYRERELAVARNRADAASKAKSEFLANMSHEIRTPMNVIMGFLQLIRRTDLSREQNEYIARTQKASKTMMELLNDILDFSKVEAGKMQIDPHPFSLGVLLDEVAVILSANLENRRLELVYDVDPEVPDRLIGDSLRIKQILLNLGGNAVKFTEVGEVNFIVRAQIEESGVRIKFSVKDTGIGMTEAQMNKVFTGFTQAESSTVRKFGGTGLGLAISKSLVELMHGEIVIHSTLGEGSQFEFELLLELDRDESHVDESPIYLEGLNVLVIDDCHSTAAALKALMESRGWSVDLAESRIAALSFLGQGQDNKYDIVLLDWGLSNADLMAVQREIGFARESGLGPVLIKMENHDQKITGREVSQNDIPFDEILVKPITKRALLSVCTIALNSTALIGEAEAVGISEPLLGLRILLVEDNHMNQIVASKLLSSEGARVVVASGGNEALKFLRRPNEVFDLVLMDIQMPDMDGYTTTEHIRKIEQHQLLPIVAMTANVQQSDKDAALKAGMNSHIGKPFEISALVNIILSLVGRKGEDQFVEEGSESKLASAVLLYCEQKDIELEVALGRLGGSIQIYKEALVALLDGLSSEQEHLLLQSPLQDLDAAARYFHILKGNVATLGFNKLSASYAALERTSKVATLGEILDVDGRMFKKLREGEERMRGLLAKIVSASTSEHQYNREPIVREDLIESIERLYALLEESNMAALDRHREIAKELRDINAQEAQELSALMDSMEFGQAEDVVLSLLNRAREQ